MAAGRATIPNGAPTFSEKGVAACSPTHCVPSLVWCVLESHEWFDIRIKKSKGIFERS